MNKKNTNKIGLALGCGGPRGLAHIGVIKALEENNIPIDLIAGSSAGALVGGLFASLGSIKKVEEIANKLTRNDLARIFTDVGFPSGLIRGKKIEPFLDDIIKGQTFETLKIPFSAVATDLSTGQEVTLNTGSVSKAIHASCALPGLFEGVIYEDKYLVDGATSSPVPVDTVKKMGSTFVIAVNLNVFTFPKLETTKDVKPKISTSSLAALRMLIYNLAQELCKSADMVIIPDVVSVSSFNLMQFVKGSDIIKKGYEATLKIIPDLFKKL